MFSASNKNLVFIPLPNAPKQIRTVDLQENGGFVSPEDFSKAKVKIAELEAKNPIAAPVQYSKKLLGTPYSFIHTPDNKFYAIYHGIKQENEKRNHFKSTIFS